MSKNIPYVAVELYVANCDHTWYELSFNVPITPSTTDDDLEKQALSLFETELQPSPKSFGDIAFYGIYSLPNLDERIAALELEE
jgi:hypothetical protein